MWYIFAACIVYILLVTTTSYIICEFICRTRRKSNKHIMEVNRYYMAVFPLFIAVLFIVILPNVLYFQNSLTIKRYILFYCIGMVTVFWAFEEAFSKTIINTVTGKISTYKWFWKKTYNVEDITSQKTWYGFTEYYTDKKRVFSIHYRYQEFNPHISTYIVEKGGCEGKYHSIFDKDRKKNNEKD